MADRYIDYNEVSEYGRHCVIELQKLSGTSDIVDTDVLAKRVLEAVDSVESELAKARGERSDLRTERGGTEGAEAAAREIVSRFYYFLRSLPQAVDFDFEAFFAGKNLGDLAHLKPADLRARTAWILNGFDVAKNKAIASFAPWKTDIDAAHQALGGALTGKGGAQSRTFVATKGLIAARERFLRVYNGVAKPIVRGLLADLGRPDDEKLFFVDLTVNENIPKRAAAPQASAPA